MSCESVRDLLSAYYDQELTPDLEREVCAHLANCLPCTQQLAGFAELSKLAADVRQPTVPADMWASINASLHAQGQGHVYVNAPKRRYLLCGIAAALLVAASAALFAFWNHQHDHQVMAQTFGQYLDRFQQQPNRAEELLVARYQGQLVDPEAADVAASFSPNAPAKLPQGYSREATYVLKMPCCTCTQTIYKDPQGKVLALFEHTDEQRGWFGERPMITAHCAGKSMSLVETGNELAGCWKSGSRFLTIVGARDIEQIAELVGYLDKSPETRDL
jgi:hypothetical protein